MLKAHGVSKSYRGQPAVDSVDLSLEEGEVVLVSGPNGAGKSTLARILSGFEAPDSGEITLDGRGLPPGDPRPARRAGIWLVPQEPPLLRSLTLEENLRLLSGRARRAQDICRKIGVTLCWSSPTAVLPYKDLHLLSLVAAVAADPSVLILDETVAALEEPVAQRFFEILEEVTGAKAATMVISHDTARVAKYCTRAIFLEDGTVVPASAEDRMHARVSLAERASVQPLHRSPDDRSGPVQPASRSSHSSSESGEAMVTIVAADGRECAVAGSRIPRGAIQVRRGEVVGVSGDRHRAIVDALRRSSPPKSRLSVRTRGSVAVVPHDFDRETLFPDLSVRENLLLASGQKRADPEEIWDELASKLLLGATLSSPVGTLSGGNRQKVALIRALVARPDVLVVEEPFYSLDAASREALEDVLRELASRGTAVVVVADEEAVLERTCTRTFRLSTATPPEEHR